MLTLEGKTILITGASRGIGYGMAEAACKAGMHVAITSRTQAAADEAAEQLRTLGTGRVLALEADVRSASDMDRAVAGTLETFGKLDAVVANAGIGKFGSIETLSLDDWRETIDVNLTGVFNTVKSCLPALKASKGYLITVASLAGANFFAGGSAYNASKFGLVGFTQAVMLDLRKHGIKVTTIMPGSVTSHFNGHEPSEADAWKIQPEDLGQMLLDLLRMHPRTLPSKIEVRPTLPPSAQ